MDSAPALDAPSGGRRGRVASRSRHRQRAAGALLAVTALLGGAGCTFTNPQTTQKPYIPGDGQDLALSDDVRVASLFLVTDAEGEPGALVARVVNGGDERRTVEVAGDGVDESVTVPARQTFAIGIAPGESEGALARSVVVEAVSAAPGTRLPLTFTVDDGEPVAVQVPVLGGALPAYAPYLPTPSPTAVPQPETTPASTPSPGGRTPGADVDADDDTTDLETSTATSTGVGAAAE